MVLDLPYRLFGSSTDALPNSIATPLKYFSFCQLRNLPGASVHYICSKKNEKEDYIQQIGDKECKESRSEVYFTGTANAVRHHASSLRQREQLLLAQWVK